MAKRKTFGISRQLSQSLSQTVEVAQQNVGALRYEIIPISRIELDPQNPRKLAISFNDLPKGPDPKDPLYIAKKKDKLELDSLASSIREKGLLNPIWIYRKGENYRLILGERRVLASLIAGKNSIPAKILEQKPQGKDLRVIQWIENVERKDLSLWERIQNIQMIINEHKKDNKSDIVNASLIKKLLNCSLPQASNYFAAIYARSEITQSIKRGDINNLEKTALLANISDEKLFKELLLLSQKGISLKHLKSRIKNHQESSKEQSIYINRITKRKGRKSQRVKLGYTKNTEIVKFLVELVLKDPKFHVQAQQFSDVCWDNYDSVSGAFGKMLSIIEKDLSNNESKI